MATIFGTEEHAPLPTLLTSARRTASPSSCAARRFPKGKIEISIPEPEMDVQAYPAYPAESVHVRNTFIHVASPAPQGSPLPRPAGSAPARHIGRMLDLEASEARWTEPQKEVQAAAPSDARQVLRLEEALFVPVPSTPEPQQGLRSNAGLLQGQPYTGAPPAAAQNPNFLSPEWQPGPAAQGLAGPTGHESWYQTQSYYTESLPAPHLGHMAPPASQHPARPAQHAQHLLPPTQHLALPTQHLAPPPQHMAPPQQLAPPAPPTAPAAQQMPEICAISMPVPAGPAPGSQELPSVGSKAHHSGECKPCAFLHVKGCDNGAMCKFCHLCEPGEKKRRQKAKKALFKLGGA